MLKKINTIIWYLKQPKGFRLVMNLLKQQTVYKKLEKTREESIAWCSIQAVDTKAALKQLFINVESEFVRPEDIFSEKFAYAKNKFASTPYQMGGAGNMDLLFNICETINAKYVLETGVAYGWSSLAILLSVSKYSDGLLVSTDMPYAKMGNEDFVGVVVPEDLRKHWHLIRESDVSALPKAFSMLDYLDVVHYDSDKSYLGRMNSYFPLFKKIRKGGIFISDDIQDNLAFKHFCEKLNLRPIIVSFDDKYVGVLIK